MNFAEILAGISRPWKNNTFNIPSAGGTTIIPFAPQPAANAEHPFLFLSPPEPSYPVSRMPITQPAPAQAVALPAPVISEAPTANTGMSRMPNANIPDILIPPAATMPAGITIEQAIAMGKALAPNINLQPLTKQDILGTENTNELIGLLPEHLKTLIDTRTNLRANKAAEDTAAVALAKQTQGLDFAQDIAKDIPRQQQESARAEFTAKTEERKQAQRLQAEKNIADRAYRLETWKAVATVGKQADTNKERLEQIVAGLKIKVLTDPNGLANLSADQAAILGLAKTLSGPEALQFKADFENSFGLLPPAMQATFRKAIPQATWDMIDSKIATMNIGANPGVQTTFTPKTGVK